MFALAAIAFALAFGLLVLGLHLSRWIGEAANLEPPRAGSGGRRSGRSCLRAARDVRGRPVLAGPAPPRRRFVTPSALFTVVAWLAISGLFAVYVSMFGSYNKAWGSLAAVIVMLTWLWLSALVLLLGAEINAEAERSR